MSTQGSTTQVSTTEHWLIEKYSRSTQPQGPAGAAATIDWQHLSVFLCSFPAAS